MGFKIWILTTFLAGTFALPKPAIDESALDYHSISSRIHGGTPAGSVPYMVALTSGKLIRAFICGASLVSTQTVLTAAHCIDGVTSKGLLSRSLFATVGTNRWNVAGMNYKIARSISHPNYSEENIKNDIGLLFTVQKVTFSNSIQSVPLHYGFIGPNVLTKVTGWGETENGDSSDVLQQLKTKTIDGKRCVVAMAEMTRKYHMDSAVVEPQIELCTLQSLRQGTCHGDSGGPLVLADQGRQLGIVSWGLPCALGAPDVFTRISAYKDWLQRNIL